MNSKHWILAMCVGLLMFGGLALDASAQQPTAPTAPTETAPAPDRPQTPPAPQTPPVPKTEYGGQPSQTPPTGSQIETRPAQNGQDGRFLGMDPTVAMIVGAVLLIVIVMSLVAMSRRGADVTRRDVDVEERHTHTRHQI